MLTNLDISFSLKQIITLSNQEDQHSSILSSESRVKKRIILWFYFLNTISFNSESIKKLKLAQEVATRRICVDQIIKPIKQQCVSDESDACSSNSARTIDRNIFKRWYKWLICLERPWSRVDIARFCNYRARSNFWLGDG